MDTPPSTIIQPEDVQQALAAALQELSNSIPNSVVARQALRIACSKNSIMGAILAIATGARNYFDALDIACKCGSLKCAELPRRGRGFAELILLVLEQPIKTIFLNLCVRGDKIAMKFIIAREALPSRFPVSRDECLEGMRIAQKKRLLDFVEWLRERYTAFCRITPGEREITAEEIEPFSDPIDANRALIAAANSGDANGIVIAVKSGANELNRALSIACRMEHSHIIALLAESGANDWNEGAMCACIGAKNNRTPPEESSQRRTAALQILKDMIARGASKIGVYYEIALANDITEMVEYLDNILQD
ncbi:MAG: hypothetical protein M0R33_18870 [Methylomonas sp.]|jgi:hypothetical protein|uniref:hypothetical protein n=1 Tax=Methylomonas sp. TaxID=418 RepID=UPI0025F5CC91|nr:hypothetical protein [Methylomonas sp.]MCK9608508.1 hypothetical protein [Methylomonas sp.]